MIAIVPARRLLALTLLPAVGGCTAVVVEAADAAGTDDTGSSGGSESESESGSSDETSPEATETEEGTTGPADSFRVAVFADAHVVGPNYSGDDPNLLGAEAQLEILAWELAQIDPPPAFAVIVGDLVFEGYASTDVEFYTQNPNAFATVDAVFDDLPFPVHLVFGDADYGVPDTPRSFSHQLFAQVFAKDPYYALDHEGWRFLFTNSQLGDTFEPQATIFDPSVGSYGANQLAWVQDQLDDGVPCVLFSHFGIGATAIVEDTSGPIPDMQQLLASAPGSLELIFAGHSNIWTITDAGFGAPQYELGATRYDTDNFLLIEFGLAGQLELLDIEKVEWNTPNADHWEYANGTPVPAE